MNNRNDLIRRYMLQRRCLD